MPECYWHLYALGQVVIVSFFLSLDSAGSWIASKRLTQQHLLSLHSSIRPPDTSTQPQDNSNRKELESHMEWTVYHQWPNTVWSATTCITLLGYTSPACVPQCCYRGGDADIGWNGLDRRWGQCLERTPTTSVPKCKRDFLFTVLFNVLKYVTVWLDKRDYNLFFTQNGLSVTDEQGPNLVFTFSHRLATREKNFS